MADDSPEKPAPEDAPADFEVDGDDYSEEPFTAADFHNVAQKQIAHAAMEMLAQSKLPWALVAPLLEAARDVKSGRPALGTTEPHIAHATISSYEGVVPKTTNWRSLGGGSEAPLERVKQTAK